MYFKHLLFKSLLVIAGLCVGTSAWADTTIGATNKGWTESGSYTTTAYTIEPNKTFTIQFKVNSTKGEDTWDCWQTVLRSEDTWGSGTEYLAMRGDAYGVRNGDWVYNNANNTGNGTWFIVNENSYNWDTYKTDINGATVKLTIKRIGSELFLMEDVTTTSSSTYKHYFGMECGDGTQNVYAFLAANNSQLTINDATTVTDSETYTGTVIGNGGSFLSGNHEDFTLGADKSLTLHFKNYSSKYSNLSNWFVEIVNDGKYLDLRADRWGWDYNANNEYFAESNYTVTSTGGDYWSNYIEEMDGADVVMTITRSSNNISITAIQTATNSVVRTLTYSLTHNDFASNDITIKLSSWFSHLDLLPVSKEITSAGWATYCSPYALNLADATGLTDAYIITGGEGGVLLKNSVKNSTVPANTGLLLKGDAGTASIPIVGSSTTDVTANKLIGKTEAFNLPAKQGYVLMNDATNGLGFYKNTNAFTVGANTAYLPADFAGAGARSFYLFDDELTGIKNIESATATQKAEGDFFDLQGRKVAQPTKGLYIVNGKKVIIK